MPKDAALLSVHQTGEAGEEILAEKGASAVDTFGGKVFVRWDPDANVTGLGPVAYFIDFLKTNGLWESWVRDCPLQYKSANAPPKQDILGTVMLSVLAGHKRYAHITTVRSDSVLPQLLGMKRVRSEDAVRRAFQTGEEEPYTVWTRQHLAATYEPLLSEPWILDMDATVKPLYGHQEQAVLGYNPGKPGRPSHVYHCYFIAAIRLVVEVEVQGRESHRIPVCATWAVGLAGRAPAGAMAAAVARRHQLGHRADDAGGRTARLAVLVQAEENLEGEAAHRPALGPAGLGGSGRGLGGPEQRVAVDWLEPEAASGDPASAVARSAGGRGGRQDHRPARVQRHGGTQARPGSLRIRRPGHLTRTRGADDRAVVSRSRRG